MGRRQKLNRFLSNQENPLVLEPGKPEYGRTAGTWSDRFGRERPLVVELGCGRGEYTVGLARLYPNHNFLGVDIKGHRLAAGAQLAHQEGLSNVRFMRTIISLLGDHVGREVDEIWLTFPDPRPKDGDERRRLINTRYLNLYQSVVKPGGQFHLKTDNREFFTYALEVLDGWKVEDLVVTWDLYDTPLRKRHHGLRTTFERKYLALGQPIHYLSFRFPAA